MSAHWQVSLPVTGPFNDSVLTATRPAVVQTSLHYKGYSNPARVTSVAASYTRQADQLHCFTTIGLQFQICRQVHK